MSTTILRKRAKSMIDEMSDAQLRVASEFLEFVKSRDSDDATAELLAISGFEASFDRGMRDVRAGRTKPWRKVRSDVKRRAIDRGDAFLSKMPSTHRRQARAMFRCVGA